MTEQELLERIAELERKVDYLFARNAPPQQEKVSAPLQVPPLPAYRVTNQTSYEEKIKSVNLLPILAVICFFLAAIFIVRLAIESGWLTPLNQWSLLSFFGAVLVAAGRLFHFVDKNYRGFLSAAGVIVLYIAAYSSSLYFEIVSPEIAQGMGALVSILCFALFDYHRSEYFAVICAIGTYLAPVTMGGREDLTFNGGFFLIWACVFSLISAFLKTRTLPLIASYLGIGLFTYLYKDVTSANDIKLIIAVLATQFAAFSGGTYYFSIRNREPLSNEAAISYLPVLLFFYGSVYYFLMKLDPVLAPWISLGFAAFLYFLFWMARKELESLNSKTMVHSFLAVVLFHSGYLQIIPDRSKPWLLPLILLASYLSEKKKSLPRISIVIRYMLAAVALLEFLRICFNLLSDSSLINVVPAIITVALGLFYYTQGSRLLKSMDGVFLGLVHLLSVMSLYRVAFDYGSLAVSLSWGFYSLIILSYGYLRRDAVICKSSLMVLGITSLKALLYDANQAASGVRIFTLIVTGIILYASGYMFKKISSWKLA